MPKRPDNEVGCSKIPLALGKLIFTSQILLLFREVRFFAMELIGPIGPTHHAPEGDFDSSSRRRAPPGMMPFGERSKIAADASHHDSAAVVVYEVVVVVRPFARKVDHHLG